MGFVFIVFSLLLFDFFFRVIDFIEFWVIKFGIMENVSFVINEYLLEMFI